MLLTTNTSPSLLVTTPPALCVFFIYQSPGGKPKILAQHQVLGKLKEFAGEIDAISEEVYGCRYLSYREEEVAPVGLARGRPSPHN